jgi:hypothetical protein
MYLSAAQQDSESSSSLLLLLLRVQTVILSCLEKHLDGNYFYAHLPGSIFEHLVPVLDEYHTGLARYVLEESKKLYTTDHGVQKKATLGGGGGGGENWSTSGFSEWIEQLREQHAASME